MKLGRVLRRQIRNDNGLKVDYGSVGAKRREEKMQYLEDTVWSETFDYSRSERFDSILGLMGKI